MMAMIIVVDALVVVVLEKFAYSPSEEAKLAS